MNINSLFIVNNNVINKTQLPGTTDDGLSGPPARLSIKCNHDNISGMNFVDVEWSAPIKPNGQIEFYNVSLELK